LQYFKVNVIENRRVNKNRKSREICKLGTKHRTNTNKTKNKYKQNKEQIQTKQRTNTNKTKNTTIQIAICEVSDII
jgi:hypothetical protein